jgi:hypothetical protein
MHRLLLIALCTSACGSATDDRPATLDYITETILTPTCASAECHSSFTREVNDRFDTVGATRFSIVAYGLVQLPDAVANPRGSLLIRALTVGAPSILDPGSGNVRMPYDAPLPDADVRLLETWISDGAHGAQCAPNDQGLACSFTHDATVPGGLRYHVIKCPDGDAGDVVQDCATTESCITVGDNNGKCVANSQGTP